MDTKAEIREFLSSRRAKVTPEQAGIVSYGERRVPGLRRNEVAGLVGVSVECYTRIERPWRGREESHSGRATAASARPMR